MISNNAMPKTINRLLITLEKKGFIYKTRVKEKLDEKNRPIKRKLIQIWFTYRDQLKAAQRFISDWLLVIDGTFNTNKDRLPLFIAVGVLNSGLTFSVYFLYCPSKSDESLGFI
jgi:hypothetical protein